MTLSEFKYHIQREIPSVEWWVRTGLNRDDSVDGDAYTLGLETVDELPGKWNEFFGKMADFRLWPVAEHQTEDKPVDRINGAFFFSVRWEFRVPKNASWRELDARYERTKEGGFATSLHWRFTNTAAQALTGMGRALTEALIQKHYSYKIYSITVSLHWSPDGEQPEWS